MHTFCHLHCHTEFSLLDGAAKVKELIYKNKELGMSALAITDHGNMFGVPYFVSAAQKAKIKPIVGCEFYIASDRHDRKDKIRYHQILLAKNEEGYKNLTKLCSLSFIEGYYYKPRIDKELLQQYSKGVIATTCCLSGEVPKTIIHHGEKVAEQRFLSWLEIFGEDYYIELQRHGIQEEDQCIQVLLKWAYKYHVKIIATNDVHYIEQKDSIAQDVLLCLNTGTNYNDSKRLRFANDQFFLKSPLEMATLFADLPETIENTIEIMDKVSPISLERDVLLPIFQLPQNFTNPDDYLRHLTFSGAKSKYDTISPEIESRINYELSVIQKIGFSGYFLIVQDFVQAAHHLGVVVGPGRGSVAGSIVAYCIGITKIDPLHYNLLFERFLNPERISMPDIDIDFDDEGRKKVIDYVVHKYGTNQVASIITFGSMAAKSAIRDVARILGLSLAQANYMAKLVPDKLEITLSNVFEKIPELAAMKKMSSTLEGQVLNLAENLEGITRHTGIHAAGIIIAPHNLIDYIPLKTDKNSDLLVTQYDGTVLENMGMLKMDFLGLKTLSIIKDTLASIEKKYGYVLNIDQIPLDDKKTFELYQQGNTKATFQFESEGIRQYLKKLVPTNIEDLIAMNALYRPGPMQFIPNFIARKHGTEKIEYPHPLLKPILKNTYGIMIYQEQIIQTAQIMAGYTLGAADLLRRAMGKKKVAEMAQQRELFVQGAFEQHAIQTDKAVTVFEIMEKFAQYGFNRSHSAAYTIIAYQTAYLKANYPAEYMASVLTHNQNDIDKISSFIEECRRQNIDILGPDINESQINFDVNKNQKIRFGLGAIKGTGSVAINAIMTARATHGPFKDLFSFVENVDLQNVNKKTMECLAMSGAFDSFGGLHRKQYLFTERREASLIEKAIQYAAELKKEKCSLQQSLFTLHGNHIIKKPKAPHCSPYKPLEQLYIEKELIGFYLSGHPLDLFKIDIDHFCNVDTQNIFLCNQKEVCIAGIITECIIRQSKHGHHFASVTLEDYKGILYFTLFGENFIKYKHLLEEKMLLYVKGAIIRKHAQEEVQEFKASQVYLLSEVREKLSKGIILHLVASKIDAHFITQLTNLVQQDQGTKLMTIKLIDNEDKIMIDLVSKRYKVNLTDNLLNNLKNLDIAFKLCT